MNEKMRILVVDDYATMRRIIKNLLGELGFANIVEAEDGASAWRVLAQGGIDFVITDWNMPGMTGLELLQKIRGEPATRATPVLMVTAEAKREQIVEAAKAGVNGYIVKPFTANTLKDKIERIFARVGSAA